MASSKSSEEKAKKVSGKAAKKSVKPTTTTKPARVSKRSGETTKTVKTVNVAETEIKITNPQVPQKENIDPMEKVLEIKAHNEEIKAAKANRKASKKAAKADNHVVSSPAETAEEKGTKAVSCADRHNAVKEGAEKAAAKKFAEMKAEVEGDETEGCSCPFRNGLFSAWGRAYKNIFNYKGRTSRYEFWSFMLINYVLMFLLFSGVAFYLFNGFFAEGNVSLVSSVVILVLVLIIEMLVFLSLNVRRLHDAGKTAWKGFFRPFIYTLVLGVVLSIGGELLFGEDKGNELLESENTAYIAGALAYYLFYLVIAVANLYYTIKIFLCTGFYEEDERVSGVYGDVRYNDETHKMLALRYASLYVVLLILLSVIFMVLTPYMMFILAALGGY